MKKAALLDRYETLIRERGLHPDAFQGEAVKKLQALVDALGPAQAGGFSRLLGRADFTCGVLSDAARPC
jgi:hypothetical protein